MALLAAFGHRADQGGVLSNQHSGSTEAGGGRGATIRTGAPPWDSFRADAGLQDPEYGSMMKDVAALPEKSQCGPQETKLPRARESAVDSGG